MFEKITRGAVINNIFRIGGKITLYNVRLRTGTKRN